MDKLHIIIGQEAICPDGLGRVRSFTHDNCSMTHIQIDTYINNRSCIWNAVSIELINPRGK